MSDMMTFGVKTDDYVDTGDGGDYIHRLGKPGEYRLRFLEEYPDWTIYKEHFSNEKKTSYPCTGDRSSCPGCTSPDQKESKPSTRYLVNAVQQNPNSQEQGYAHLWKLPYPSLVDSFKRYMARSGGTLTDRDFTITRNDGDRVSYDIDREDKEPMDISKFTLQNHQEALAQEYAEAWDPAARAAKEERIGSKSAAKAEQKEEPQADEPEVPDALLSKEERAAKAAAPKLSIAKDPEPEPEEVVLTPSAIRRMQPAGIVRLFEQGGFEVPDGIDQTGRDALADALIAALSE